MIPNIKYPLIANLIDTLPLLFSKSAMIGIYDGQDICSCFLNKAHVLKNLYFYENFHDSESDESKNNLIKKYNYWETNVPNLSIEIGDGTALLTSDPIDFLFTDAYNIDYSTYFLNKQFNNTLMAICGYGAEIKRTVDLSVAIKENKIFPVLLYKDFLFFTNNKTYYTKCIVDVEMYFKNINQKYIKRIGCIKPFGAYHELLSKQ